MKRSNQKAEVDVRIRVLTIIISIFIIAISAWALYELSRSDPPASDREFTMKIENTSGIYSKDRYVELQLTATKVGDSKSSGLHWNDCAETIYVALDGDLEDIPDPREPNIGSCLIGGPFPWKPGETQTRIVSFDPTRLSPGLHRLKLQVNGYETNEIRFHVADSKVEITPEDCYQLTEHQSPMCKQIKIVNTMHDQSKEPSQFYADRCEEIIKRVFEGSPYKPVASKSTIPCDGTDPEFLINVPPKDFEKVSEEFWQATVNGGDIGIDADQSLLEP